MRRNNTYSVYVVYPTGGLPAKRNFAGWLDAIAYGARKLSRGCHVTMAYNYP